MLFLDGFGVFSVAAFLVYAGAVQLLTIQLLPLSALSGTLLVAPLGI